MQDLSLRTLADIETLRRHKAAYGRLVDGFGETVTSEAVAAFRALFTEDLVAEFNNLGDFQGLDAFTEAMTVTVPSRRQWVWHSFHSPDCSIDGDRAHVAWTLYALVKADRNAPRPEAVVGRYFDDYVRTPEGWKQSRIRFIAEAMYPL
jgi:hypothetical protein